MTTALTTKRPVLRAIGTLAGLALCAALLAATPDAAPAQAWPSRTIQAVIPFAPGNANDVVGRIVLDQLSKQIGQPIVVENRSGAGGATGVGFVAKSAPDGNTILVHSSTFSAGYSLYKSLPYDTFNDFIAVIPLGIQPTVLIAAPSKGWKTLGELVAFAKANPGKLNSKRPCGTTRRRSATTGGLCSPPMPLPCRRLRSKWRACKATVRTDDTPYRPHHMSDCDRAGRGGGHGARGARAVDHAGPGWTQPGSAEGAGGALSGGPARGRCRRSPA
jgi:hypothetical protein